MAPSHPHRLSRRRFVHTGSAAIASLGLGLARAADPKKIPIGLQLYSVRNECQKDLAAVIQAVGKMGYKGVEFAGYYGRDAKTLRKLLDDNGLVCCGTHTPYESVQPKNLQATVEFNRTLGNPFLIVPSMGGASKADWLAHAKLFNEVAAKVKADGLFVGYHAHGHDFRKFDGETAWDIFFGNTKPEVVMQLDTSNCRDGGADPLAVLKKYPGRAMSIHLKEWGGPKDAVIGGGEIPWKEVFQFCETQGATRWYVVEHERAGGDPLGDARRCLEALRVMGNC